MLMVWVGYLKFYTLFFLFCSISVTNVMRIAVGRSGNQTHGFPEVGQTRLPLSRDQINRLWGDGFVEPRLILFGMSRLCQSKNCDRVLRRTF